MINKLWTNVSLENYNNWYPLTGKIAETPQQYIKTWPNVNDWFKTFAIRAQNDINAYLDFILSKFPFDSFKDELIKETLRDMVYVMVEHWVFNRTPIEFNVDATIQFNNGSQFSANSTPTINVWDLAPSRMKIWARLTELKQIFSSYNDDEIDVEKIDLKAFYTRNQVDKLIKEQKEFTLLKQIKLYDDLVNENENEIYRGPVSKFINKGYVATDYDKETETMILDWPNEIGTLPPEALQNNPQIGDYTHAATCDFSAKQQKRITTNENEITKLNSELIKANENINDVKNNWFNIETSPLWKKVENNNIEMFKWYFIKISYQYSIENNFMKFYKIIKIYLNNIFNEFELLNVDSMTYKEQIQNKNILNIGTIYYNNQNKKFSGGGNSYPERGKINLIGDIEEIYQYQGTGTPTEFIAEDSGERDYYKKLETNNLLDKKQDKLIAGTNITIDKETNTISAICTTGESLWMIDPNSPNIIQPKEKRLITANNTSIVYIGEPEKEKDATTKKYVDDLISKKQDKIDNLKDKIFNNKDDKDSTTRLVNDVINVGNRTLIYKNKSDPSVTYDNDIPNKKYVDDKIDTKQEKIDDLINKIFKDKKQKDDFIELLTNAFYLANNLFDENQFFGTNTKELGNKIHLNLKGIVPILKSQQIPELETYYKSIVDAINELNKKIPKIKIKTLNIDEVDNTYDIELKNNPTPTPSGSNWKEVGEVITDKNNNNQNYMKYIFKDKTHYRIYISYGDYTTKENNKNYSWQIINFYYQLDTSVVKSSLWIANNNNNQQTEINIYNNIIMWGMGRDYIFKKLEELQE